MINTLVDVYVQLVKAGKLNIEDVPIKYREAVRKALEE